MQDQAEMFGDYAPKNFDGDFRGTVTAKDALRMSLNVPAVMVLERVGPLRFALALEHVGVHVGLPGETSTPSLPIALGGLGISLRDMTMLYAGIADGGTVTPLREIKEGERAASFRLFGPTAAYYLRDILSGAALPDGWAMGQGLKRTRSIAFKTGTSYGYRDAWAMGFSNDYTVGIWVGRADGAPRADRLGREDAAPVLLKVFDLLPADKHAAPAAPAGVIATSRAAELPPALRVFKRETNMSAEPKARIRPPAIVFPPDGAVVSLASQADPDKTIALKAEGGRAPLTWLVNGAVLGSYARYQASAFTPDGEGFARITVIDADGRSATARVRFKRPRP
jgi:penicillin-binding protein 1C